MEQNNYNIIDNICHVVITIIIIPTIKFYALNNIVSKFMKKKY